ncbi:Phox homologous domain-containing protein [Spinellus fusiger]|nr:Phox homologous domain-containing protein [Spinellus fusiger]
MTEPIQAILIPETSTRSQPKPHTVFKIDVQAAVRNWTVWKRYSEFHQLHQRFLALFPQPPPTVFPSKHYFPSTFSDAAKIEARRRGLEDYLRGMLSSRDDRWRQTDVWKDFLAIPVGRSLDAHNYTSESWLDEYTTLNNTAREIRSLINKRTAHMNRDEVSASHNCTMQAKKLLMQLSSRTSSLDSGLVLLAQGTQAIMSQGELRRRQDMLTTLKDERDTLMGLVNTGRQDHEQLYKPLATSAGERKALLGTKPLSTKTKTTVGMGRALGPAYKAQDKAQETAQTRGMVNSDLSVFQQKLMEGQDQQVMQFSAILSRQRQLGLAIGDELETQSQLLDELDGDVDRTHTKLKFATKKLANIR